MSFQITPVSKSLEKKLVVLGFEVPDLLAIFLLLAILNFALGSIEGLSFAVWLPPLCLAGVLRYGKRGKPDNYLVHLIRFKISPGVYSAFKSPKSFESEVIKRTKYERSLS